MWDPPFSGATERVKRLNKTYDEPNEGVTAQGRLILFCLGFPLFLKQIVVELIV